MRSLWLGNRVLPVRQTHGIGEYPVVLKLELEQKFRLNRSENVEQPYVRGAAAARRQEAWGDFRHFG